MSLNHAVGPGAANHVTGGQHNIAVGAGSLARCMTGCYNIALGVGALADVTSESYQIQLGSIRLPTNQALAEALYEALFPILTGLPGVSPDVLSWGV